MIPDKETTAESMRMFERLPDKAKGFINGYIAAITELSSTKKATTKEEKTHDETERTEKADRD